VAFLALLLGVPALASAKNVLIVNGASLTSEPGTTSDITANLVALETAAGNTTTVVDTPPVSLVGYTEVWDIRFSNTWPLSAGDQALYSSFLQAGNSMFIMGENSSFPTRNNSIFAFVTALGGGSLAFVTPSQPQTVNPPFTGPNAVTSLSFNAPGGSSTPGTGSYATNSGANGTAIAWKPGQLAAAPAAALVVVFDVNFMQASAGTPLTNFLKNLIGFINAGGNPTPSVLVPVPTLSEWSMIMLMLLVALGGGMVLRSRARRTR
jgi:hypothetical protein